MKADDGRILHYRILGELGRDRLGRFLRAVDETLDRPVALRVVRAAAVYPAERVADVRAAFQRTARMGARVSHPNLATIYSFERDGDADIIALELVEGTTLRAMLARGDRWAVPEAARLLARVADGLAAAHAEGVAHGDLTLSNVVVREDGRVKVLDLGVPKLRWDSKAAGATPRLPRAAKPGSDVKALGLIGWELVASTLRPPGALWRAMNGTAKQIEAGFGDPQRARGRFGVVAPVLARALGAGQDPPFRDAAELRDAVLAAVQETRLVAPEEESAAATEPPAAPLRPTTKPPERRRRPGELLDAEGAVLAALEPRSPGAPRLVLPADLARSTTVEPPDGYVVMRRSGLADRLRLASRHRGDSVGPRWVRGNAINAVIAAILLIVVVVAAILIARRLPEADASAVTVASNPATTVPSVLPAPEPSGSSAAADTGGAESVPVVDGTEPDAPVQPAAEEAAGRRLNAMVRASPGGTRIEVPGVGTFTDQAELAVEPGDSLTVRFSRAGYVGETHTFLGRRISVALRPDSVNVRFQANVPARVYATAGGRERLIGTTGRAARLPTGTHRLIFRADHQPDWDATHRFPSAGQTYEVRKPDYVTRGSLIVTVAGTWAWITVDGGQARETPLRVDNLEVGAHELRVSREGYETITDTVIVLPGDVVTKQYTLRPTR